jgi:hypothetical protein
MARLTWGALGERFYETGVDRCVLYWNGVMGVAWNGISAVRESPSGGEAVPYYFDGVKYLNLSAAEEYEATLEAFASPAEFNLCDGTVPISNGLFVTQQPRTSFGLSYRTAVGNDVEGVDHGYKIHIVYNALAAPSSRDDSTISDSPDPATLSWAITAIPAIVTNLKPTSHFVVDSRLTDPALLTELEDDLYGTVSTAPTLPTPTALVAMFTP